MDYKITENRSLRIAKLAKTIRYKLQYRAFPAKISELCSGMIIDKETEDLRRRT